RPRRARGGRGASTGGPGAGTARDRDSVRAAPVPVPGADGRCRRERDLPGLSGARGRSDHARSDRGRRVRMGRVGGFPGLRGGGRPRPVAVGGLAGPPAGGRGPRAPFPRRGFGRLTGSPCRSGRRRVGLARARGTREAGFTARTPPLWPVRCHGTSSDCSTRRVWSGRRTAAPERGAALRCGPIGGRLRAPVRDSGPWGGTRAVPTAVWVTSIRPDPS